MKPGDVVVGVLAGAFETKVRPAVVIASSTYLVEQLDAVIFKGFLTYARPCTWPSPEELSQASAPTTSAAPISASLIYRATGKALGQLGYLNAVRVRPHLEPALHEHLAC